MTIKLNGDAYTVPGPLTITDLLARLEIDPRRVAVERNFLDLTRAQFSFQVSQLGLRDRSRGELAG